MLPAPCSKWPPALADLWVRLLLYASTASVSGVPALPCSALLSKRHGAHSCGVPRDRRGIQIIVHARVVDVRSQWVDGRRRIESVVTVEVLTPFKGGERRTLEFRVPGGQIGRYRSMMVGAPSFSLGEEAFLFLSGREQRCPLVFGLNQGVFPDQAGSRVRPARRGAAPLMASSESREAVMRGSPTRRPLEARSVRRPGAVGDRPAAGRSMRPRARLLAACALVILAAAPVVGISQAWHRRGQPDGHPALAEFPGPLFRHRPWRRRCHAPSNSRRR